MAKLIDLATSKEYELPLDGVARFIGRRESNDIHIEDEGINVSRYGHAIVLEHNGVHYLGNVGGNGTYIEDSEIGSEEGGRKRIKDIPEEVIGRLKTPTDLMTLREVLKDSSFISQLARGWGVRLEDGAEFFVIDKFGFRYETEQKPVGG